LNVGPPILSLLFRRLFEVGRSLSIITIAGPIIINACATFPSGSGRRTRSTAPNVLAELDQAGWVPAHQSRDDD